VIPPSFLAASIDASPEVTKPRIFFAQAVPVLVDASEVAIKGTLTDVARAPELRGCDVYAHPASNVATDRVSSFFIFLFSFLGYIRIIRKKFLCVNMKK
jgi:hypothetical protein